MPNGHLNHSLLAKQAAGLPLTIPEAREMVIDLKKRISSERETPVEELLLMAIGVCYYTDVWDIFIIDITGFDC